jgi:hypothetical protein
MSRNDPLKYGIWGLTLSPDWIHHILTTTMQSVIRLSCMGEFIAGHVGINGVY